ncbi:MAG: NlpC/P60 family protein [Deltaproteobacteria bacterium]|jgi:cell wall-associated NlpC family hydrolase
MRRLNTYARLAITLLLVAAAGCAPVRRDVIVSPKGNRPAASVDLVDTSYIRELLYRQFDEWREVPYRTGGLSKNGVDCSGFVYLTYLRKFGIRIPRTTKLQAAAGRSVRLNDLRAGDLVFFRTGIRSRHVGIYLEKQLFIHASKSSGVMVSRLNDAYWSQNYWKAVRIRTAPAGTG